MENVAKSNELTLNGKGRDQFGLALYNVINNFSHDVRPRGPVRGRDVRNLKGALRRTANVSASSYYLKHM